MTNANEPEENAEPAPTSPEPGQSAAPAGEPVELAPKNALNQLWPEGTTFGRADRICLGLIIAVTIFGLVMLPARPVILTWAPLAIVALTGSRTGMVACGALAATGGLGLPMPLSIIIPVVVGIISIVKFDPIYWWAGRLWGDWFIKVMGGQTERSRRRADRAENLARRYMVPAMGLTYVPFLPVPVAIIYAVLGASGTSIKKFLGVDLVFATIAQCTYFTMGWMIGEPAVMVLDELAKYSLWLAGAIFAFILFGAVRSSRIAERERQNATVTDEATAATGELTDEATTATGELTDGATGEASAHPESPR